MGPYVCRLQHQDGILWNWGLVNVMNCKIKKFGQLNLVALSCMTLILNLFSSPASSASVRSASCFYMSYGQTTPTATGANLVFSLSSTCSKDIIYQVRYLNISLMIQGVPVGFAYVQGPIKDLPINSFMTINFGLLSPGNYPAFLSIMDDSGFIWQSPAGTINVPKTGSAGTKSKFVCASASKFETSCQPFPDWSFEFCSKLGKGTLQEYVGGKWKSLWKVEGEEDSASCDSSFPYFVELSGTTSLAVGKVSKMRVLFKSTSTEQGYSQNFSLTVKR